jgi:class 3 adenylate cyclase/YHS domain-containing protein
VADLTFLIGDLAGYTALTEAHGGEEAARVVARYAELAEAAMPAGVQLVERVGDAVLMVGAVARDVVLAGVRLRDAVEGEPVFPEVSVGIDCGAAIESAGRYFGTPLNVAARLAAHARPGQVLCTQRIVALPPPEGLAYRELGPVRLRNVPTPVTLFEVVEPARADEGTALDPVCRMRVRIADAPARLPYRGAAWYFCSFACARLFAERPSDYAGQR